MAELVAYPVSGKNGPPLAGSVSVDPRTDFQAAALRMRWEWFGTGSFCDPGDCSLCQWGHRVDVTLGFRYLQLNDNLGITEELTYTSYVEPAPPTPPLPQGSVLVQDSFRTYNVFQGGEMGLVIQNGQGRWTMEVDPQIALGNTQESVAINGSTTVTSGATGIPERPCSGRALGPREEHRRIPAERVRGRAPDRFQTGIPVDASSAAYDRLRLSLLEPGRSCGKPDRYEGQRHHDARVSGAGGRAGADVHVPGRRILGPGVEPRHGIRLVGWVI